MNEINFKQKIAKDHIEWFMRLRLTNDVATTVDMEYALLNVPEPYKEVARKVMLRINKYSTDVLSLIDELEIDIHKLEEEYPEC